MAKAVAKAVAKDVAKAMAKMVKNDEGDESNASDHWNA